MAIIQKRADELKPGDVFPANTAYAPRIVVEVEPSEVHEGRFAVRMFSGGATFPYVYLPHDVVDVEAPDLTPAQQHADELAKRLTWALGFVETYARDAMGPATPEWNKVRAVLDVIKPPEPATLAEALKALAALQRIQKESSPEDEDALHILNRARRAGQIK